MTPGLWLNEREFVDLDKRPVADLLGEVAVRSSASWLGLLPDPDPVLRQRGDDGSVLADLTADDKVFSSIQGRKIKTLNKSDYRFEPGHEEDREPDAEATRLARDLTKDLERTSLYNLISEVLDAPYYGYTPIEIIWRRDGGRYRIERAEAKPRSWFNFDSHNRLCFRGEDQLEGRPVHPYKFVLAAHFPTYENPYGLRILSRCLWPVAFKQGGVEFLMRFAERFGMPWVVGEARPGAQLDERQDMLAALSSMVRDAVAVVSGGSKITVSEVSGQAGTLHSGLVEMFNSAIAQIIQGQTLTQDVGDRGTQALGTVHHQVLTDYARADETLLCTALTDLAWVYGQVNAPGVLTPTFSFEEPEDLKEKASLAKDLHALGARFTPKYFESFGLAPDEFTVADSGEAAGDGRDPGQGRGQGEGKDGEDDKDGQEEAAFAGSAGRRFTPAQQAVETLVAGTLPLARAAAADMAKQIMDLVRQAETPEDLLLLLSEAYADLDATQFEACFDAALTAAQLVGIGASRDEAGRAVGDADGS